MSRYVRPVTCDSSGSLGTSVSAGRVWVSGIRLRLSSLAAELRLNPSSRGWRFTSLSGPAQ